jgi:hypothetical protein
VPERGSITPTPEGLGCVERLGCEECVGEAVELLAVLPKQMIDRAHRVGARCDAAAEARGCFS